MKRLSRKLDRPQHLGPIHISPLPNQRVTVKPRLQPDLIATAGHQGDLQQRCVAKRLEDAVFADRLFAQWIARVRFLLNDGPSVPHEVIAPPSGCGGRFAINYGQINALRLTPPELSLQPPLCVGMLCEHDQPRRIAVDPMYDERTPLP